VGCEKTISCLVQTSIKTLNLPPISISVSLETTIKQLSLFTILRSRKPKVKIMVKGALKTLLPKSKVASSPHSFGWLLTF
jgi:hypothetical protein